MECHVATENRRRPVARIVVSEGADAGPYLAERFQSYAWPTRVNVIGATHRQRQAIAPRQHDAGRPYLHIDLVDLPRGELLLLVMGVVGAVRQRELLVELAVRAT